jgi:hypothetical protein
MMLGTLVGCNSSVGREYFSNPVSPTIAAAHSESPIRSYFRQSAYIRLIMRI